MTSTIQYCLKYIKILRNIKPKYNLYIRCKNNLTFCPKYSKVAFCVILCRACVNNYTFRSIFAGLINVIVRPVYRSHPLVHWSPKCGTNEPLGKRFFKTL